MVTIEVFICVWLVPEGANAALASEIVEQSNLPVRAMNEDDADQFWSDVRELRWSNETVCVKVATTPEQWLQLQNWSDTRDDASMHLSVAGAVGWMIVSTDAVDSLHTELCKFEIAGTAIRGTSRSRWGHREVDAIESRIKLAMDPDSKF